MTTKEDLPQLHIFSTLREEHERALARAKAEGRADGYLEGVQDAINEASGCWSLSSGVASIHSLKVKAADLRIQADNLKPGKQISCTICQGAHLEILCPTRL